MALCNQIVREKHRQRVIAMGKKVHELRKRKHQEMVMALNETFERVCRKYKDQDKEEWVFIETPIQEISTNSMTINLSQIIVDNPLVFTHIL